MDTEILVAPLTQEMIGDGQKMLEIMGQIGPAALAVY
jgi:hypothetical protein